MNIRKTVTIRLAENVLYPLAERRCVFCRVEFSTPAFNVRRSCGACPAY